MKKPYKPDESELLAFLDEELSPQRQAEIRQQLAADWELRAQLAKLERRVEQFVDVTAQLQNGDGPFSPDELWRDFSARLDITPERVSWHARLAIAAQTLGMKFPSIAFRPQRLISAFAGLLALLALPWLLLWRTEQPVSAQEFLQRTTQAESARLQRVDAPVIYRKVQIKRADTNESVEWESWNDDASQQFRQRVADRQGLRFLRANETTKPVIIADLERIFRANRFDARHPLSATAFAAWRAQIRSQSENVFPHSDQLQLTTVAAAPYARDAIIEASLLVRRSDWHTVALQLRVQGEGEIHRYEFSETAYEILPLQALTVFTDLPITPTLAPVLPAKDASIVLTAPPSLASPSPTTLPSLAALHAAEVEALYALHQAQADLGEQVEVLREDNQQVVVRGLVRTAARKEELNQALRRISLVSPQIQTIEEAVQQAQRNAQPVAGNESSNTSDEMAVSSQATATAANAFQQKLTEHFGGRKGLSEAERQEVNRQVSHFYNTVESEASAAMSEAWALRRLQERFASSANVELDAAARQRLEEMQNNHLARLRQRSRNLQARLQPLLVAWAGEMPASAPAVEVTRPAQRLAAFRAMEQISRLTDQLIAGTAAAALPATARDLLAEFARLDAVLRALESR